MSTTTRDRHMAAGLCPYCCGKEPLLDGKTLGKKCAIRLGKTQRRNSGKAPPCTGPRNRRQRAAAGVFVGGKSASARARGKAPIAPAQMERSKFEDYLDQGSQLRDLRITPVEEIHSQSTGLHDLRPEQPHALRRPQPKRVAAGPQDGIKGGEAARPKSTPAVFVARETIGVVLW